MNSTSKELEEESKVITLDSFRVVAGLEWTALPSEIPERKALSEYISSGRKNKKPSKGIIVRSGGVTVVGRAESKIKIPKDTPSAAALIAFSNQKVIEESGGLSSEGTSEEHNWIVVEKLDDYGDDYWMGAVKNGVPIPGGDIIGNLDKMIEQVGMILAATSNFTIFTTDKDIKYNFVSETNVIEKSFSEFVREIPTKKAELTYFSIGLMIAAGIFVVAILAVGTWWGYSQWVDARKAEQQQRATAARVAAQQSQIREETATYEREVEEAVLEALRSGMGEISAGISTPSPREHIDAWMNIIYNTNIYQHGWEIKEIECGLDGEDPFCNISLDRGALGVNRLILEAIPDVEIEGDSAYYTIKTSPRHARNNTFDHISSAGAFERGLISDLQILRLSGLNHDISASQEIVKQATIPPPPAIIPQAISEAGGAVPPQTSVTIQLGFGGGTIGLRGDGMWQLKGVANYVDIPNVRARALKITINTSSLERTQWDLALDYFVRTNQQPIIPAIRVGEGAINIPLPEEYRSKFEVSGGVEDYSGSAVGDQELGISNGFDDGDDWQ